MASTTGRGSALLAGFQLIKRLATVKPKEAKTTVGVDFGSSGIKLVALGGRRAFGPRPIIAAKIAGVPEGDGKIADTLKELVHQLHLPAKTVTLSVNGQWVIIRVVEMPKLLPEELSQALPIEAQRHLPFSVQDVVLDGAILGPAEGGKMWVLLVACKRELLERRVGWVTQAGLTPVCVDVDALALANAFLERDDQKRPATYAVLDIGAQRAGLVVFKGASPYLIREIPVGAVKLIRRISEQLGRDEQAVRTLLKGEGPLPADAAEALKNAAESLTSELALSFDFFESRFGPMPEQVFVTGGFSRCAGLLEALKALVSQPMTLWTPRAEVEPGLVVAYGLALRADVG